MVAEDTHPALNDLTPITSYLDSLLEEAERDTEADAVSAVVTTALASASCEVLPFEAVGVAAAEISQPELLNNTGDLQATMCSKPAEGYSTAASLPIQSPINPAPPDLSSPPASAERAALAQINTERDDDHCIPALNMPSRWEQSSAISLQISQDDLVVTNEGELQSYLLDKMRAPRNEFTRHLLRSIFMGSAQDTPDKDDEEATDIISGQHNLSVRCLCSVSQCVSRLLSHSVPHIDCLTVCLTPTV